jgi:hypothetical protein
MVLSLRCLTTWRCCERRVVGRLAAVVFACLALAGRLAAQEPNVHYLHAGVMPPGAIGSRQLQRGGPLPGFYQPVEIKAPQGTLISLAEANQFDAPQAESRRAGFLIGSVYRLRATNIPMVQGGEGLEVFPTIEVIDRLYAPPEQAVRFAILVELTAEDMQLALQGKFVTRVIYLENPKAPLAVPTAGRAQEWYDIGPSQDPLAVADALGRPVAILRMGGRLPEATPDPAFFFGSPPWVRYGQRPPKPLAAPQAKPAPAAAPEGPQP